MIAACLLLLTGVMLGALGAHALDTILTEQKKNSWQLAVQYQLVHGIGMILIALLYQSFVMPLMRWSGTFMFIGILIFSGTIYLSALMWPDISKLAPYGGSSLMLAWLLLAISVFKVRRR